MLPKRIGYFDSSNYGRVAVLRSTYEHAEGPTAVMLELADGSPLGVLSVNMYWPECSRDSRNLPPNCFYVKNWSENVTLARDALASGLFKLRDDLPVAYSGFIAAPVWEIKEQEQA